eukprot:TRINITY_DN74367_c0_g1_i1.p2 TRINITY_DN74367_c0_g1~~TRINITY_DN74367_c0_g1_i1.p2  ORF type:complete len:161 (+),score=21.55 TRINITY_DN74367_c0_g1_i1:155-637(+)
MVFVRTPGRMQTIQYIFVETCRCRLCSLLPADSAVPTAWRENGIHHMFEPRESGGFSEMQKGCGRRDDYNTAVCGSLGDGRTALEVTRTDLEARNARIEDSANRSVPMVSELNISEEGVAVLDEGVANATEQGQSESPSLSELVTSNSAARKHCSIAQYW